MKKVIFTRQELHQLLWSEPISTITKKYDTSSSELRSNCKYLHVPMPKADYWQKKRLGKQATVEPLPLMNYGNQILTLCICEEGEIRTHPELSEAILLKKEIESESKPLLSVPLKLSNPDKLIIAAKDNLIQKQKGYLYNGMVSCSAGLLDIRVTPSNIDRALRFMDTLIKLLRSRMHEITISGDSTFAVLDGEKVKIACREKLERVAIVERKSYERSADLVPTGILSFKMTIFHNDTEWTDKQQPVEKQLSGILAKMEVKAKAHKAFMEICRQENEKHREESRLILEQKQRAEQEITDFKNLLNEAQMWHQTAILRNYLNEIETLAISNNTISENLRKWLLWARKKADLYDPMNKQGKAWTVF